VSWFPAIAATNPIATKAKMLAQEDQSNSDVRTISHNTTANARVTRLIAYGQENPSISNAGELLKYCSGCHIPNGIRVGMRKREIKINVQHIKALEADTNQKKANLGRIKRITPNPSALPNRMIIANSGILFNIFCIQSIMKNAHQITAALGRRYT
jgi:hypothetical protein